MVLTVVSRGLLYLIDKEDPVCKCFIYFFLDFAYWVPTILIYEHPEHYN